MYAPGRLAEPFPRDPWNNYVRVQGSKVDTAPGSSMNRQSGEVGAEKVARAGSDGSAGRAGLLLHVMYQELPTGDSRLKDTAV